MKFPLSLIMAITSACLGATGPAPSAAAEPDSVRTPPPGHPDRRAILDAVRPFVQQLVERDDIVFVVDKLLVCQDWAWFQGRPQASDQTARFEDISALVRRVNGGTNEWRLVRIPGIEPGEIDDPALAEARLWQGLKHEFPDLPQALVDAAMPAAAPAVHTPPPGHPERRAILDAVRPFVQQLVERDDLVFVVDKLLVCQDWAWFQGRPQASDESARFEDISALVRRVNGGTNEWRLVRIPGIEPGEIDDPALAEARLWQGLKHEFPELPQALVDAAMGQPR